MRSRIEPAINAYHSLIDADLSGAEEQLDLLLQAQIDNGLLFGGRPMAGSLRPTFLTEDFYNEIQDTVYLIRQAVLKLASVFFNDAHVLEHELGLQPWEIEYAAIPTNVVRLAATARMDSFVTERSFKFVEVNGEVPAGIAYIHGLAEVYRSLPVFRAFERKHPVRFVSPLQHTIHGLLQIYSEQFDGRESHPRFAIVDFLDVPTRPEFDLIESYLEKHGIDCVIADPRSLDCVDGWIYADGKRVDILYRRLLMNEFYEIRDECPKYLQGYRAQKTCFLNSFRTKLVHKKALFAMLTDERFASVLTPQQQQTIHDHIPWTRMLKPQKTTYGGVAVDLLEFVRDRRSQFIIKPNDAYGGSGVTLGFEVGDAEWETAIERGVARGDVVQETVDIHREPFLVKKDGAWDLIPTVIDLDPYLNGPLMGGCLTRVTSSNLANVTAGGGTLPMFILRYS